MSKQYFIVPEDSDQIVDTIEADELPVVMAAGALHRALKMARERIELNNYEGEENEFLDEIDKVLLSIIKETKDMEANEAQP